MTLATVIGAGGFIGGRLVEILLAQGRDVLAPGRGDLSFFQQPLGTVFYCAGLTGDFGARPFDAVEAHVGLIAKILRDAQFDRLIYLSSIRLYDSAAKNGGRESDPLTLDPALPRHVYDLSKALGENLTLTQSAGRGSVARLGNVFDLHPLASGFLSELLARATREQEIFLESSPKSARDYIHVDDAVTALMALESRAASGIVNVARGENIDNAELSRIFKVAGRKLVFLGKSEPEPPPVCDIARLRALGVQPRDARNVLHRLLAAPSLPSLG